MFEQDLRGSDFSQAQIQKAYLSYINLSNSVLFQAQLQGSELSVATMYSLDAREGCFDRAVLIRANLSNSKLTKASLVDANLQGADLRGTDLRGADLRGADLSYAYLQDALMTEAQLSRCNLFRAQRADVNGAICDRTTVYPDGHRSYP